MVRGMERTAMSPFVTAGWPSARLIHVRNPRGWNPPGYATGACGVALGSDRRSHPIALSDPEYGDRDWCDRCLGVSWARRMFVMGDPAVQRARRAERREVDELWAAWLAEVGKATT